MPALPGDSIQIAREYLDSLLVESRIVGSAAPDTSFTLLGKHFKSPIMTAALSHVDLINMAKGAAAAGAPVSIGMGDNDELQRVLDTGAQVMKIIKPYADDDQVFSRLAYAKEHGAMAVGMDVEHAIHADSARPDCIRGISMKLPTMKELAAYVSAAGLPFFIKGAMSVQDALACRDLGCAGVILSHHNGLMRYAAPHVMLLPGIRKAVGDDFIIVVDGGMESGYDAFKALALGANCVTVGRSLMEPLKQHSAQGVTDVITAMTDQLAAMLCRTGSADISHIDPSVIHSKYESPFSAIR